jgi:AcrR family transcriptional regulator
MPSQQAKRALGTREKIMKAATVSFAAKGFEGTSTRDVARKAKVNEITIFRLFKNKQDLYLQILDRKMGLGVPEWLDKVLRSPADPEITVPALAERLEKVFDTAFLRLFFYTALEKPELLRKRYGSSLGSLYKVLGRHIREQTQSESLREIDPMLMGRALVGMIAYQRILSELLGGTGPFKADGETSARIYAEIGLFGTSSWRVRGAGQQADCAPASTLETVSPPPETRAASGHRPAQEITPTAKR